MSKATENKNIHLIASAKHSHDGFVADVYKQCWKDICGYIRSVFGTGPPDPEDVAQNAFVKFAALNDPKKIKNPHAFLIKVARNIVLDHYKSHKIRSAHLEQIAKDHQSIDAIFDDLTPERVILGEEEFKLLRKTLANMSAKRREFFILQRVHGLSY